MITQICTGDILAICRLFVGRRRRPAAAGLARGASCSFEQRNAPRAPPMSAEIGPLDGVLVLEVANWYARSRPTVLRPMGLMTSRDGGDACFFFVDL